LDQDLDGRPPKRHRSSILRLRRPSRRGTGLLLNNELESGHPPRCRTIGCHGSTDRGSAISRQVRARYGREPRQPSSMRRRALAHIASEIRKWRPASSALAASKALSTSIA
jgi:hypothetical protein